MDPRLRTTAVDTSHQLMVDLIRTDKRVAIHDLETQLGYCHDTLHLVAEDFASWKVCVKSKYQKLKYVMNCATTC